MKTITLRKETFRFASILAICLILGSCKNEQTPSENSLKESKELALKSGDLASMAIANPIISQPEIQESKDTYVLLTIDTKTINENNVDSKVVFSDDRSDPATNPGNPKTFTSIVDKNMKIYWSGVAKDEDSNETIDIIAIYRKPEGGAEILESTFRDPNKDGIVIGKVKNKKVNGLEYYIVVFRINGETPRTFAVDPKLQMGG
jgi:hypothetical protein